MTTTNRNTLTPEERYVIEQKWTERPFTGELLNEHRNGTFVCRRCESPLYYSDMKFESECGRPSFDNAVEWNVTQTPDPDWHRVEITCTNCGWHLWHVFTSERFTANNVRHCVNSLSMKFVPYHVSAQTWLEKATFGGGCFWCMEAVFQRLKWVVTVESWFMWWTTKNPSYEAVCYGITWHIEVVQLTFDPTVISYQTLLNVFFSTHNPTQVDAQWHDVGTQYASAVFYHSAEQKELTDQLITQLEWDKAYGGLPIVTKVIEASDFWKADSSHANYYNRNKTAWYCSAVIDPKIAKLRSSWAGLLKE